MVAAKIRSGANRRPKRSRGGQQRLGPASPGGGREHPHATLSRGERGSRRRPAGAAFRTDGMMYTTKSRLCQVKLYFIYRIDFHCVKWQNEKKFCKKKNGVYRRKCRNGRNRTRNSKTQNTEERRQETEDRIENSELRRKTENRSQSSGAATKENGRIMEAG